MAKSIKYKVYDTINKTIYTTFVSLCPDGSIIYLNEEGMWEEDNKNRFIALLYSDVKDINGNDIYEGMKVRCSNMWVGDYIEKGGECDVIFEDGSFVIKGIGDVEVNNTLDEACVYNGKIKIIGWSFDVRNEI